MHQKKQNIVLSNRIHSKLFIQQENQCENLLNFSLLVCSLAHFLSVHQDHNKISNDFLWIRKLARNLNQKLGFVQYLTLVGLHLYVYWYFFFNIVSLKSQAHKVISAKLEMIIKVSNLAFCKSLTVRNPNLQIAFFNNF